VIARSQTVFDYIQASTLCIVYLAAGCTRFWAGRRNPAIRKYYYASVPLAAMYVCLYLWLLFEGDSPTRTFLTRLVVLVSTPVVWIFPAIAALRIPGQAHIEEMREIAKRRSTEK
jgi:hypothetical protein